MFDGSSFKKIKRSKIGGVPYRDKLTAVWFELLDLAGKANANGYLVDSNEVPYTSFEEIAVMLDREEEEINLCMEFFVKEKMVEIVEGVICISAFMEYQNQDGLERIREQKRIAQAKWRERKRTNLVVESTVESTVEPCRCTSSYSYSNCISNSVFNIYEHWNSKNIIVHKELTEEILKAIKKALDIYTEEQLRSYIDRYAMVLGDAGYFWHYKWTLRDFLTRKDGISSFTDEGSKWVNYMEYRSKPKGKTPQLANTSFDVQDAFAAALSRSYSEDSKGENDDT
jgi:predicted phage replisome organizer